ncbi:MAG: hypothetical protein ACRCT8_06505, partial [Lacipirellulaceae bacterium]
MPTARAFLALLAALLPVAAVAEQIVFNTDTGVMTIDGVARTSFFGVTVQSSVVGGKMQFRFLGNLDLLSIDTVNGVGSRPLSLLAGNDVNINAGAVLNFDAGAAPRLGGGAGGGAVPGGSAGAGGREALSSLGGAGGAGGEFTSGGFARPGDQGGAGGPGRQGAGVGPGQAGSLGNPGQAGFN